MLIICTRCGHTPTPITFTLGQVHTRCGCAIARVSQRTGHGWCHLWNCKTTKAEVLIMERLREVIDWVVHQPRNIAGDALPVRSQWYAVVNCSGSTYLYPRFCLFVVHTLEHLKGVMDLLKCQTFRLSTVPSWFWLVNVVNTWSSIYVFPTKSTNVAVFLIVIMLAFKNTYALACLWEEY